jgi:ATP-binding cassette, subfamily B, multidrug efflux pump
MKNLHGIRALLALLRPYWLYAILGLLCCALADLGQIVVPMVSKTAIDALQDGTADWAILKRQGLLLLGIAIGSYFVRYGWRYFMFTAARRVEQVLRARIYARAIRVPLEIHLATRSGDTMSLVTNDLMSVRMALAFGLMSSFDAFAYSGMSIAAMFSLDSKLALLCLIPYPFLAFIMLFLMDKSYKTWDRVQKSLDDLTEKSRESIAGMRVLRAYAQEDGDALDFKQRTEAVYRRVLDHIRWEAIYEPSITLASGFSSATLLILGGQHVISGKLSLGGFAAFSSYLGQLMWPMIAAGWTMAIVQRAAASMVRIEDLLERPLEFTPLEPPPSGASRAQSQSETGLGIRANHLNFRYPQIAEASLENVERVPSQTDSARLPIQDVSFSIEPGQSLGLMGEVGCGKSTLCSLLMGFYPVNPGQLFVDGKDITQWHPQQLRSQVAWVGQDAFLFSDTIEANLRFPESSENRDAETVRQAACDASLDDEVGTFPNGYETMLGERGVTLSGGQRQRLTLARAFLRDARLLILDDTLSAVDSHTESHILDALSNRLEGRTSLIVSHRVSSVRRCDLILVLQEGRVIQSGTHQQLLEQPGYYRNLYEMQTSTDSLVGGVA